MYTEKEIIRAKIGNANWHKRYYLQKLEETEVELRIYHKELEGLEAQHEHAS